MDVYTFARKLSENYMAKASEREKLRVSFSDRVLQIFEAKEICVQTFQELTLLSRNIFYLLRKQDYRPSFETVIALCAGLDLDIIITAELLGKAGYAFDGSEKHNAYEAAITQFRGYPIHVRNEFLRELKIAGIKLLGEKDSE